MTGNDKQLTTSTTKRHYEREILSKLSLGIIEMNLGEKTNTALVHAGVYNVRALRQKIISEGFIEELDDEAVRKIKHMLMIA